MSSLVVNNDQGIFLGLLKSIDLIDIWKHPGICISVGLFPPGEFDPLERRLLNSTADCEIV